MERDAKIRTTQYRAMPRQSIVNSRCHAFAYALFFAPCPYVRGFGIAECNAYRHRIITLVLDLLYPGRIRFWQMKAGIDEDIDALCSGPEKRKPQRIRYTAPLCVDRDDLSVGLVNGHTLTHVRPQVGRIFFQKPGSGYGRLAVRCAVFCYPAFDRFTVNA